MTRNLTVLPKVSTLALAVAMAAGPSPAIAQSFQGTVDSQVGASVDQSTPGQTNVTVTQEQAVINWTATNNPSDGTIIFQPEGTSATFTGTSNFAVLNRVTPGTAGNAIFMGGSITSLINETVGGTVYFYSPNGIIIGRNASINVGSLGLTTLPIADNGEGSWISNFGQDPQVSFGQASDPNSFIRTDTVIDGSINAHGAGSYVALVAPRIEHSGVIRTDTAAALVAAEAATITFSPDGLFDVTVTVGTDDANGVDVNGGTIERRNPVEGPQPNGPGEHYAYLVAVAKNDAVTMLVRNGGSIGFDTATSAAVEDNVVILSGGRDIEDGQIAGAAGAAPVNLNIDSSTFTTDVLADVSGGADIRTSTGNTSFGLDPTTTSLDLTAGDDSIITANNGNTLAIAGSLWADLDVDGTGASATGSVFRLSTISASTLTVGGDVTITAQTFGAGGQDVNGGNATGGTAIVQTSSGGTIDIAGDLNINVDGWGGSAVGFDLAGGSGTGGIAHILANGGSGASLTVGGEVNVSASGTGGSIGDDCFSCLITGGNGTGGTIMLQALTGIGNSLNLNGAVTLTAEGNGAAGDASGGNGLGGNVQLASGDAGAIMIEGDLLASTNASGGFGMDNGESGGQGGSATGGNATIVFSGAASTIDLNGTSNFSADASAGNGVLGGNATGGWVNLQASNNGTLTTAFLGGSADAFGGSGFSGGAGTGGRAWVQSITGGDILANALSLSAEGFGGSGESTRAGNSGATGGAGTGGIRVIASADGAGSTLTVTNTLDLEAGAQGGFGDTGSSLGGTGLGGQADIFASNGGTVTLNGFVSVDATGRGGNYFTDSSTGGNGTGGTVFFQADNGGTLTAATEVQLDADGIGGFSFGDCNDCGGTGGDGTGGTVTIQAFGGAATMLTVDGEVNANAIGFGSSGFAGPGGDGQGGTVKLAIQGGATANLLSDLFLNASGNGGWQTDGGLAGNGTGGLVDAFVGATGGTLTVGGFASLSASGFGGTTEGFDGTAGDGLGGTARFLGLGGTSNFDGDLILEATGHGGSAGTEGLSGTGGDGMGRNARISAAGGDINIAGTASVSASGFGGSGTTGGSGTGGGDYFGGMVDGAHLFAQNGDLVIGGAAIAMSDGVGADGIDGGNGGNGTGGWASIHAANGNGGPSSITVQAVEAAAFVSANGTGGSGGDGLSGIDGESGNTGTNGAAGTAGGNGGIGTGGVAAITAASGNGTLNIDIGFVDANGIGGAGGSGGNGGAGGNGDTGGGGNGGAGGIGGRGGDAFGGLASMGVEPGTAQAAGSNLGTANFAFMEVTASAEGGAGGAGGIGGILGTGSPNGTAGADGNGGAGGDVVGGVAELQARGGTVNVISALLTANATGGDGGVGAIDGAGGDAESDEAYVLVTNRPGNTALRGTLNAGSITAVVASSGGNGSTNGLSAMEGGSGFFVINGDATIGSFDMNVAATSQIADLATDMIELINADVVIDNDFTFNTSGVTSVYADNATLTAGSFAVSASNFIHDPDRPFPASVGTISADTFDFSTDQDLIVDAHLISTGSLNLIAPGQIDIEDATSGGDLTLQAGSTIDGGTQTAAGFVVADAFSNITLGNVNAGSFIDILSDDGDISLAFLSAGTTIDLEAGGNIGFADVTADDLDFDAGGDVTGGDIIAGTQATGDAAGAVDLGNINVGILQSGGAAEDGFAVGITSATSIDVGDVDADEAIGFATLGNLTTGDLSAGNLIMTLVGGDIGVGAMTTTAPNSQIYMADAQMFLDAGGAEDDFDASLVLALDPVMTGGSITIDGPVDTTLFRAAAGTTFTANDMTALGFSDEVLFVEGINVRAGGLATVNGTWTGEEVNIASDDIDISGTGAIDAGSVGLVSTNAERTIVGDGVEGSGYRLSDAEYDRISATGEIEVGADAALGAAPNMIIGDLSVTNNGEDRVEYEFATYEGDSENVGTGSIRIVGDAIFTGTGVDFVGFTTGTFELDAATGLLSLEDSPGVIGGELFLNANHIHVASGEILDQLAEDPQYDGYQEDLNAPATVQRPEGVIRAGSIEIEFGEAELNTLYVQNSGTADLPAGFVVTDEVLFGEGGEETPPPGSIDLIINGQIVTEVGTLTGVDVRDALVEAEGDLSPFTENSTINGCLLVGPCVVVEPEPPFPPGFTPTPGIQDEIRLIDRGQLPPPLFGNEDLIDDNIESTAEGATSPVEPPVPLFDTSALGDKGDVDDPVSGSGNPALMETSPAGDSTCPADGSAPAGQCKQEKQP